MSSTSHHTGPRKQLRKTVVALVFALCTVSCLKAQSPTGAAQVKAVFLFNFTQFVNWPSFAFTGSTSPFVIGVLGSDPFGAYLDNVVDGERVGNHPIVVQRFADVKDVRNCHILFINNGNPATVLKALNGQGMLTVSDSENFASEGGIVRFYLDNNRIRLQINEAAAKAAGLVVSSKLLRLANVISKEP